jgi:hypothetical protein
MGPTVNGLQTFRETFRRRPRPKASGDHQDLHDLACPERNRTFRETFRTFRRRDLQAGGGYLIPPGRVLNDPRNLLDFFVVASANPPVTSTFLYPMRKLIFGSGGADV